MANSNDQQIITLSNFNHGGLSDSKFSGLKYSMYRIVGMDLHSIPGVLQVAQKMTNDAPGIVDEFVKCQVTSSNGYTYHFSSTSGKIWQRDPDGNWILIYTTAPTDGEAGCLGAYEYQGIIYWATEMYLHRITAAGNTDETSWESNVEANWAEFNITDPQFHPMIEQNGVLYIGDGCLLAQVDAGVYSPDALDIVTPLRIKCLGKIGTDVLLGTYVNDHVNKSQIIRWDTYSVSFNSTDEVEEVGINAFIPGDNVVYVQAGIQGNIYVYNGEQLILYKRIPGKYDTDNYARMHPNASANFNGKILMGLSKYYSGS